MSNYINGVSYPIMEVRLVSDNSLYTSYNFDLCMSAGLVEDYKEDFKRVELETGTFIDYDFKGSRIEFSLDYAEYAIKDNLFRIEEVFFFNSMPDTYRLIMTPRADVRPRFFEVRLLDGAYSLGIMKGGAYAAGNRLPVIKFITKDLVGKHFLDPADINFGLVA